MRKNIDIEARLLNKLELISTLENMSVKALIEKAIAYNISTKETEKLKRRQDEEKLDLGMFMLMQEADKGDMVSRDEIMELLKCKKAANK